ncbi:hypothetical protein [Chryseobacterium sp. JUb7]|uniref:hypothetical protein n=1 Tax=Chryseobacterium sp. JUb7 TaxID=2940599 RepID=UPI00216A7C58|nr:hypothetical protein [Chryseobacterium sp. JUb7]MCS3529348.1 hypothetical protein [Chryseobacterium sp. JUb7]
MDIRWERGYSIRIMRYVLFLLSPFLSFAQNISIELADSKAIEFYSGKNNQICINIKNHSKYEYEIPFDKEGFSTSENEAVDDSDIGIAGFRIFKNELLIKPITGGSYGYQREPLENDTVEEKELALFTENNKTLFKQPSEFFNSYKINKRVVSLKPKENKSVCMNINLPIYKSFADDGSLLYNLEDGKMYNFQIFLSIPQKRLRKYILFPKLKSKIFTGSLVSNKILFIYKDHPDLK